MRKRVVLIVEDHDGIRSALTRLFRLAGWDALGVATVAEGLSSLDPAPDFAVVDLMLPDGDGEDVVRAIANRKLPTRVAVCSGTGDAERLEAVRRLGPAVLQKPVTIEDVFRVCGASIA